MKLLYDAQTDSLYIDVVDRPGNRSQEIAPGVVADYDTDGRLVGLDIEHASRTFDLTEFALEGFPVARIVAPETAAGPR